MDSTPYNPNGLNGYLACKGSFILAMSSVNEPEAISPETYNGFGVLGFRIEGLGLRA